MQVTWKKLSPRRAVCGDPFRRQVMCRGRLQRSHDTKSCGLPSEVVRQYRQGPQLVLGTNCNVFGRKKKEQIMVTGKDMMVWLFPCVGGR